MKSLVSLITAFMDFYSQTYVHIPNPAGERLETTM